jgi:hypothetical protein
LWGKIETALFEASELQVNRNLGACPRIRRSRAHGACTASARREEEAMQGHR